MKYYNETPIAPLVTPDEAVTISWHRAISDCRICDEIVEAFYRQWNEWGITDRVYARECLWAAIWNAGRIHGIRSERQRRRSKKSI